MQLKQVKISNLMSFPYQEDISKIQGIQFTNGENINILIGPNGAGKSNLFEIISQSFKVGLVKNFFYNKNIIIQNDIDRLNKVIMNQPLDLKNKIHKHFLTIDKKSESYITFNLTDSDYDNLGFICKYASKINYIIQKYSNIKTTFENFNFEEISNEDSKITLNFEFDIENKTIKVDESNLSKVQKFILKYLQNIQLFEICIDIYNSFEKKEQERKLYPLKNSFAIITTNRKLEKASNKIDTILRNYTLQDVNSGYYLCLKKIWDIINNASEENVKEKIKQKNDIDYSYEKINKKLKKSAFFTSLEFIVNHYLNKTLDIEYKNGEIILMLIDQLKQKYKINDLGSGDQSFLFMIFTIYGYDMKGGTLIIDEPELHFSPQRQRSFVSMITKINKNISTQFIISTYSPLFINETNITNVYKFSKINGNTQIRNPIGQIPEDESSMVHILKFENLSKIFFVDKIIMVEGETDSYFFDFYLKYLHANTKKGNLITNYEIININGKGGYKKWKKFLGKFGLQSYFIGDWDNIIDYGILKQEELTGYYQQARKIYNNSNFSKNNRHYNRLVNTVKITAPDKYNFILQNIQKLYEENIFILKKGDIETYLGLKEKGLENTIT
ncbi:MAG: AAA family ATPase, partial [Candidatus Absconditabacterales bacterium]